MPEHSVSNPFTAKAPVLTYGALRVDAEGAYQYEGFPYVGPPFDFKDDDPDEFRPQKKLNACVAQFDLSKPEDMEQYRGVSQRIADGLAQISFEEKNYDEDTKTWRIFMRWLEPYYVPPSAALAAVPNSDAPGTHVMPETPLVGAKDLAEARAEEALEESTESEESDESRYATVDQAFHAFGDKDIFELAGVGAPGEDSPEA
jgi:hypothetical protein